MIPTSESKLQLTQPVSKKTRCASVLTSADRRSEHVGVETVVISELKFGNVERHIFSIRLVECAERSNDSIFNAEYRLKRTHCVTTGLDPVVHGDILRMRRHGERLSGQVLCMDCRIKSGNDD
jgi:hypothetical protein